MSRAYNTNLKPLLTEQGVLLDSIGPKKKRLIEHLGVIIASVTEMPSEHPKTVVTCWNKINRKSCPGIIDAGIELHSFNILWHCLACGDHGYIRDWEHSIWDGGGRR